MVVRSSEAKTGNGHADCVHIHGIWSPCLARQMRKWKSQGIPMVVSPHGMLQPWARQHKRWKKALAWSLYQRQLLNAANVLHATSTFEAEEFRKLGLRARVAVIPWGITLPTRESFMPRNSVGNDAMRTALFVGRIYPVKGLLMLVRAWALVRPKNWRMRVVGPDEAGHRAEVEALVQKLNLSDVFEFSGELSGSAKQRAYAETDLFIAPSYTENFGMAIGEAMAHGLPVITTQGTPWNILREEGCGWWTAISADGIAAALKEATNRSGEELQAMGQRGFELVREKFTWQKTATDMKSVYEWMLGLGPQPDSFI